MNWIVNMPIELRLAVLFLVGVVVGGQLNRGIYRLAWEPRDLGPWSPPPEGAPRRRWYDRIPVCGWWLLRRESSWHGRGFWVRPLLIELATGFGFAALYVLEVQRHWLWPAGMAAPDAAVLHAQYFSHIVLLSLMIVATFIDFDEQTIPDEITVTGAVIGLLFAIGLPASALPTTLENGWDAENVHHLVLTSSSSAADWLSGQGGPHSWPPVLNGPLGLALAWVGIWTCCFAIAHKTWTTRRGVRKAVQFMVASIVRRGSWLVPMALALCLTFVTGLTWLFGTIRWESLLTAVVGMCFGGGLIWAVRVVGGYALRMEAMGFGDVTLMAMIGAFLGWQTCFLIFFLAPFTALFVATGQRLLAGHRHIAFGPYLCLSTLIIVLAWDAVWTRWANPMFAVGWLIPIMLGACMVLMGALLWLWRITRDAFF